MAGYRMPQDEMALLIINPQTKRPISETTLKHHFADELAQGYASLRMRIMAATVRNALGEVRQGPNGQAEVVRDGNVTAQIWLQKTLYGAREQVDVAAPAGIKADEEISTLDAARRVAFTLALGARIMREQKSAK
jgi:hypothetical protein